MTGHQASRPTTRVYLHLKPRSPTTGPDQSSSPGHYFRAAPLLLVFLSTTDYAEQQAISTPADQHLHQPSRHNPALGKPTYAARHKSAYRSCSRQSSCASPSTPAVSDEPAGHAIIRRASATT